MQNVGDIEIGSMVTYRYYDYQSGSKGAEVTIEEINANVNEHQLNPDRSYLALSIVYLSVYCASNSLYELSYSVIYIR